MRKGQKHPLIKSKKPEKYTEVQTGETKYFNVNLPQVHIKV